MSVGSIYEVNDFSVLSGCIGTVSAPSLIPTGSDLMVNGSRVGTSLLTFGTDIDQFNQQFIFVLTCTRGTTTTLRVTGVRPNVVNDANATLSSITIMRFEYLTLSQDPANGTAGTGNVTIQPAASNPLVSTPLATSGTYTLKPGCEWFHADHTAGGMAVTSGSADQLDFVNADAAVDVKIMITLIGRK